MLPRCRSLCSQFQLRVWTHQVSLREPKSYLATLISFDTNVVSRQSDGPPRLCKLSPPQGRPACQLQVPQHGRTSTAKWQELWAATATWYSEMKQQLLLRSGSADKENKRDRSRSPDRGKGGDHSSQRAKLACAAPKAKTSSSRCACPARTQ